jgi:hypothetical protein
MILRNIERIFAVARHAQMRIETAPRSCSGRTSPLSPGSHIYAGNDPELGAILDGLSERDEAYAQPMVAMAAKAEFFATRNVFRMRSSEGKARLRPTP